MYRVSVETMSNSRPKMRIPGFAGEVFAEMGVNPTNIAPGELYTALERNTIDAVEWVGSALDLRVAMRTASFNMLVLSQHENAQAWASIKKDFPNVQIKQFPQDIFQAMFDANKKLLKEAAEGNEQAARIIKSQEDYLAQSRAYTEISERAYLNTMGTVE